MRPRWRDFAVNKYLHNVASGWKIINTVTLTSLHSTLPDDGDHTETFWPDCNFNLHFNTP